MAYIIKKATFAKSSSKFTECPEDELPEFAFIGRSNVGKSSLINKITNKKDLAKTSQTPGKTQLINHFLINEKWYLVDLPGYGWAKVGQEKRMQFSKMIKNYLLQRKNLKCVFVLIDSRLEPQAIDFDFLNFLGEKQVPFVIIYTKIDKNSSSQTQKILAQHNRELMKTWEELPLRFMTSSQTGAGCEDLKDYMKIVLDEAKQIQNLEETSQTQKSEETSQIDETIEE
ncbi:MAG: YihA family ribosome biogenesis GTP-binding protein [Cytophagia bacterium]|nr:MAG: YihA family ribosome biogenesis GTP-binding protein [Cytophagales bacterium]TAG05830.1 MAG: YihA family ribosome biogenesis GTP-binding protein [Cytophagia bacterium]TAG40538.1 MAG: YihA family ribosome biogenesis GTP-binding protein [Cytophagia bacterium]TAH28248.1 MAG: YihA family ribosome biogenesis GTP-binding protein [Cytophagales bacterium]